MIQLTPKIKKLVEEFLNDLLSESKIPTLRTRKLSGIQIGNCARDESIQVLTLKYLSELHPLILSRITLASKQTAVAENLDASPQTMPQNMMDTSPEATLKPGQVPSSVMKKAVIAGVIPSFHLPNCKVGEPYSAVIECLDNAEQSIIVTDIKLPEDLGLVFNSAAQKVEGQPQRDGEFTLDLQWHFSDAPKEGKSTGQCKLISIPDPRSLWKVIEPAPDLPYKKPHLDQKLIKANGFNLAAASRRGRSHENGGSFRDDDFFIANDVASGWSLLLVADGAGSAKNSREGARIAVNTAGIFLENSLKGEFGQQISVLLSSWDADSAARNMIYTHFYNSYYEAAKLAIQAIEQEAQLQQATAKEYATTLLIAAVKKEGEHTFLATFWMGDGAIAAYDSSGILKLMGTPDGGEFAGQTRFLDRHALADQAFNKRVSIGRYANISSVILMTDGVSDPYFETDNELADPAKWDLLWSEIFPLLRSEDPEQRLVEWLHFFKKGHHDDRTIALLWS